MRRILVLLMLGVSAGRAHAQPASFALSAQPSMEIRGDADPKNFLVNVAAIIPLSGRRIAVVCWGEATVRIYDQRGILIGKEGREGDGPHEFRYIYSAGAYRGDSIWVADQFWRRVSILDSAGRIGRRFDLKAPMSRRGAHYLGDMSHVVGALGDGSFVVNTPARLNEDVSPGAHWFVSELLTFTATGTSSATLDTFRIQEALVRKSGGVSDVVIPHFTRGSPVATDIDGVIVGGPGSQMIQKRVPVKNAPYMRQNIAPAPAAVPVLERHVRASKIAEAERIIVVETPVREIEPAYSRMFPPYVAIVPAKNGRLWLQGPELPGDKTTVSFIVVPGRGIVSRVTTPSRFVVHAFDGSSVIGVLKDADDVEHIQQFQLPRTDGRP